ncbi:MAG: DUF3313 domain-containing protein [Alphaproteobacteria bacterium]|nr:DUF3313 domain-containing protein [Alphaproteobacteria bacterium]MBU2272332.1 DUF3313 domain-containing protein [Alphaproteobacteria bacterium]MBU2419449.1 DUF3313 domain-containing protein [Alphaproteobacteria bacterium]
MSPSTSASLLVLVAGATVLGACQTAPAANAGFLSTYDGLETKEGTLRVSVRDRRDDGMAAAIERLFVEPAQLAQGAAEGVAPGDVALVLGEVDRQVCYELSRRFTLLPERAADAATARIAVTRIEPTGAVGSGLSAVASAFIPGPIGIRPPGSTGMLAAEAELVTVEGTQAAALAWARSANVVGMDSPSLSRVGDALQFAEVLGDQVAESFAPDGREARPVAEPDPCAHFGPREQPGGFITRFVTGLYVPETQGVKAQTGE